MSDRDKDKELWVNVKPVKSCHFKPTHNLSGCQYLSPQSLEDPINMGRKNKTLVSLATRRQKDKTRKKSVEMLIVTDKSPRKDNAGQYFRSSSMGERVGGQTKERWYDVPHGPTA